MLTLILALGSLAGVVTMDRLEAGSTYRVLVTLPDPIAPETRVQVTLEGTQGERFAKTLHLGDPDFLLNYRPHASGQARLNIDGQATVSWSRLDIPEADRDRFEAEPNDIWNNANPLTVGRDVYGTADDVDYLDNLDEGRAGIDWFRFEITEDQPVLVSFQLELLDRDVSANLRVHRLDPSGQARLYEVGKDPTEVIHDRERERYSTHVTRTFTRGTFFLEVNANHPAYVIRSQKSKVPPLQDPAEAVALGMDYLLKAGDAWFAQIPREGHIYTRAANLHETATRCTACHASSYPTEAALVAHRNGYPIQAKASMAYLIERLANSPTPLYGDAGLNWQRFIAIPLQAQGKQGGILADFEAEVSRRETPAFERFVPFLRAAWLRRETIPADEQNGVVPADSKFALLWRDWRVLELAARRTGKVTYAQASDNIADILADPASDRWVETFQDRIHRLYAWHFLDPERYAARIEEEVEALFALQNNDGGWHEMGRHPAPSADYTTGQLAWTLMRVGVHRNDPRIRQALQYLMARQQPFGGWFQTTTHENFRTPMRETRYAVEALAEGFPRPGGPLTSWGNRDNAPARSPRAGPLAATLDDLDNLWEVPEADQNRLTIELGSFLNHAEPLVRAHAAACLGRVGNEKAIQGLIAGLNDPSKVVVRAVAWALRSLGNRGLGVAEIGQALDDPSPAVRRGATRIFAYQFYGMDTRIDLADRLIARTDDADLWTRLQALRSLRQWFYRTSDNALRRRIVDVYLARMALEEHPVVRRALIEGLYTLLDENLGGGVSLQRNLMALPESYRQPALKAREVLEAEVLLGPVLGALETGNDRQREAILRSFDGSFLRGRGYARQPSGMIDVGNDREFGFLHAPDPDRLERLFSVLLSPEVKTNPTTRSRAIRLASFFGVPGRTSNPSIQEALLRGLTDPEEIVRSASRDAVVQSLALVGAEEDPARVALVLDQLRGPMEIRSAVAIAISRNSRLFDRPEVLAAIREQVARNPAGMTPLLSQRGVSDTEIMAAISHAWPTTTEASDRIALVDVLSTRPSLIDADPPEPEVLRFLRTVAADPSTTVREKVLNLVFEQTRFREGRAATSLLMAALVDAAPSVRRLGLGLAGSRIKFWSRPETWDRLLALLVDPDAGVRDRALATVEREKLLTPEDSRTARRLKALQADPALKPRVEALLRSERFDPESVVADRALSRPRPLGLARFRTEVNPWFSRPGADGVSCVQCHANHGVFRVVSADLSQGVTDSSALMTNYASALRVIDLVDPESSRLLLKPRSPQGQGTADSASPTGWTHAGGPRWADTDHPAYRAILNWIREASAVSSTDHPARASADGHAPGHEPGLAVDGDLATAWRTEFVGASPGYPHDLVVDLGSARTVDGLLYIPRQEDSTGRIRDFEVALSDDGLSWSAPRARGAWPDEPTFQYLTWPSQVARYVRLRGLSAVDGGPFMAIAEVAVDSSPPPVPIRNPEPPQ